MGNSTYLDNVFLDEAVDALRARLPEGWKLVSISQERANELRSDAQFSITGPDGANAALLVEIRRNVSPRIAAEVAEKLAQVARRAEGKNTLLISNYLSKLSQKRLREARVNYLDLTGNVWIDIKRPGLLIETHGANLNPSPQRRGIRSLKGRKAARIVRALCDIRAPIGVREIARLTRSDPGYVSRVLAFLVSEDLIERNQTGQVARSNWKDLIMRWGEDYSLINTNLVMKCLAPRGLDGVIDRLRALQKTYALTGSFAVPAGASVAVGRQLACYVDDPGEAMATLEIRETRVGANVLLIVPFDEIVFERVRREEGVAKVALSQCAVDLLTGGGRGSSEAEALLEWMTKNEDEWRS